MKETFPGSIERVRQTVLARVRATSLRAVAREVGMSPSGLEKFLSGGNPYSGTRRKLYNWWLRAQGEPAVPSVSSDAVDCALRALLHDVAPALLVGIAPLPVRWMNSLAYLRSRVRPGPVC